MKKLAAIGVAVGLIVGLAGCTQATPTGGGEVTQNSKYIYENRVTLADGTQVTCLALVGNRQGGLSCDWANAKSGE